MAMSILFLVQDIPCAPKFSEHDFWKIVSTSYRIGRIFGRRSVAELWGATSCVGSLEMCYKPIGRKYTKR